MSTMTDSVDRVFAHALQTVRRIPRTGTLRPPPSARLKLYGLYKQSMEGDVTHIMPRPPPSPTGDTTELEKWEAWHACRGLKRVEAKRRYIETLIETMKRFASRTREAKELVGELEFIWEQVKGEGDGDDGGEGDIGEVMPVPEGEQSGGEEEVWRERVEEALGKMTAEVAALREQLEARRGRVRRERVRRWMLAVPWVLWAVLRHLIVEAVFWGLVVLWMRKRGDKRAEEALRLVMRFVKEGFKELGLGRRRRN